MNEWQRNEWNSWVDDAGLEGRFTAEEIKTASTDPAPTAGNEEVADAAVPDIDALAV